MYRYTCCTRLSQSLLRDEEEEDVGQLSVTQNVYIYRCIYIVDTVQVTLIQIR